MSEMLRLEDVCKGPLGEAIGRGLFLAYQDDCVAFAHDYSADYVRYLGQKHGRDALAYRDWLRSELLGGGL